MASATKVLVGWAAVCATTFVIMFSFNLQRVDKEEIGCCSEELFVR